MRLKGKIFAESGIFRGNMDTLRMKLEAGAFLQVFYKNKMLS